MSSNINAQTIDFDTTNQLQIVADSASVSVAEKLQQKMTDLWGIVAVFGNDKNAVLLEISIDTQLDKDEFKINSNTDKITINASSEASLNQAFTVFLNILGYDLLTENTYYLAPENSELNFPVNFNYHHIPAFEYRFLYYPGIFSQQYKSSYNLHDIEEYFAVWGHSFHRFLPPDNFFEKHPEMFALYEGKRSYESICYSHPTTKSIFIENIEKTINNNPEAEFISVSHNDTDVYCQCNECEAANKKFGDKRGAHYVFLNEIAHHFPDQKIMTLAYLHTLAPPENLAFKENLHVMYCPISVNRGASFDSDPRSKQLRNHLKQWKDITPNLHFWDYTVQFTHFFSAFPNIHTLQENYQFLKEMGVIGVFSQGSADEKSHFYEVKQYLLTQLLHQPQLDDEELIQEFFEKYYGKAATAVYQFYRELTQNQLQQNQYLGIYDNPIRQIDRFLSPEKMSIYDEIIQEAEAKAAGNKAIEERVNLLRLSLEYTYFEQSKYFGKDQHGMFVFDEETQAYKVRSSLNQRVKNFAENLQNRGVDLLAEAGMSPENYYKEWLEIVNYANVENTLALDELKILSEVSPDFKGKGSYALKDKVRGYKNFEINWIGFYKNDAIIQFEIAETKEKVDKIRLNFLEDQRHWIFRPTKIQLYKFTKNNKRKRLIAEIELEELKETYEVQLISKLITSKKIKAGSSYELKISNQPKLPQWRVKQHKHPMIMIDEIEVYAE
ncbi:MAG: DUF4838 domain-containing protein [Bacteroidota bacterium]